MYPFRSTLNRLDHSFKRFFKHGGFPRFKGRNRGVRSFETSQFRIRQAGKRHAVEIKGFGKIRARRLPEGEIRLIRVVKNPIRVKVRFVVEIERELQPDNSPVVGIDMGVSRMATFSDGSSLPKIVPDETRAKRLRRKLSKAQRGSDNRRKKRAGHAKERQRQRERQHNALHRLSTDTIRKHGPNLAVEDLRIPNMTAAGGNRKRGLNRSILEQNWGAFVQMLTCKAESAGGKVIGVNPKNTSKTCSGCGHVLDMPLSVRTFDCGVCGLRLDRDHNAAVNIAGRAIALPPGGDVPGTPRSVEIIGGVARRAA